MVTIVTSTGGQDQVIQTIENAVNQTEITDQFHNFFRDSRNKFLLALANLSHYLPLSVQYAVVVGHECDIVEYNKDYYTKPGLIIAGVLTVIGIVFCFFGEQLEGLVVLYSVQS